MSYEYDLLSERYKKRFETPPGLTELWQVSGKNHTTFQQMMNLDLTYMREKSLWLDLKIIAWTIPAIMKLIWEMKIRPKLLMDPVESAAKTDNLTSEKAVAPQHGTIPISD